MKLWWSTPPFMSPVFLADNRNMLLSLFLCAVLSCASLFAQTMNPLYTLPHISQNTSKTVAARKVATKDNAFLCATDAGLFRVTSAGAAIALWTEGSVYQIACTEYVDDKFFDAANTDTNNFADAGERKMWFFRTSEGILFSSDLENFEMRNEGLPVLTLKKFDGQNITFKKQVADLKDICINPSNPLEIVTATKDAVYFSKDAGLSWRSLGSMSRATPGIKSVAVATVADGSCVVFMAHTIFGLSYILPNAQVPRWIDTAKGLFMMPSLSSADEISDIFPVVRTEDGKTFTEIYLSQMYVPRIYKFDWAAKKAECIYAGTEPADSIDGLSEVDGALLFCRNETLDSLDMTTYNSLGIPKNFSKWQKKFQAVHGALNAAWVSESQSGFSKSVLLNELWMLYPGNINSEYAQKANGKKSLYASAYQCRLQSGIDKFKKIIKDNKLNSLVIDMKDDYGLLRYESNDELVKEKATVTQYKIDLDHFVEEFKKDDVYLIARIVVFKDRNLSRYARGKFAVWDSAENKAWQGTKGLEDVTDEDGNVTQEMAYYDEFWVDPYAPEVWQYNVAIAKELIERGFDEIQFDYIRFPTDGQNLGNATYRHKSAGMDKESALISFLSYARENIQAPIGIDIYGANGWYRSGSRTGQDSEQLSRYVDVICPMFYPSHFEASFMHFEPYADRTYRIYYYGTYRNTVMTRNRAIIRPWVQAFKLNVAFDRTYYGADYIQKQIFGVRDSVNRGYMYWNNSGDYTNLLPDISDNDKYTGTTKEASTDFRKPALGNATAKVFRDDSLFVLDTIRLQKKYNW